MITSYTAPDDSVPIQDRAQQRGTELAEYERAGPNRRRTMFQDAILSRDIIEGTTQHAVQRARRDAVYASVLLLVVGLAIGYRCAVMWQ